MKILDKYIISKFLGTFFYAIALIISIAIIFDFSEKVDDFLQREAPARAIIFDYYFNFIPYFVNLFSPLFTFIAVVFFTSKMASDTEIVAILASGVSFKRMLRPYLVAASVLAILSFLLINFIIPPANKTRLEFEEQYIRNPYFNREYNIHRQIGPGNFIYFESYNNQRNIGYKFSIEHIDKESGEMKYKLMADVITWDTIINKWKLENYFHRTIDGLNENVVTGHTLDTLFNFYPDEFGKRINNIETMNYFELNEFIEQEKFKGSDYVVYYEIEKYQRMALPFATFILTIIGVSIASRKVRGGIGLHIGLGLLISFTYILFLQISTTFATNAGLAPVIAVWIPNILYMFLGIYLLKQAPK
ncbi:MAG: LptF/LptG family permease [Bacteroidetes bacterium]|nr:LptF/LptG family permease [Bacteroidota bacterium]HET6244045.1 LptF/LptG family permease [Bacteroidia bacterium]